MDPAEFEASFESDRDARGEARVGPPLGFLDNRIPALVAQVMLALNPLLYLGLLAVGFADAFVEALTGESWGFAQDLIGIATPVELGLRAGTAIAFVTWLYRVSKNMHLLAHDVPPEHSPANAVVAWFVPCANLWLPYQVVGEIDRRSDPQGLGRVSRLVSAWWGAWVVVLLLLNAVGRLPEGVAAFLWLGLFAGQIVAATLAILVVRRIQKNQIALATRADAHAIAAEFA